MTARACIVCIVVAWMGCAAGATAARAQDFESAAGPAPSTSTLGLIERGLSDTDQGLRFETGWIGRHRLPELATRAAALGIHLHDLHLAVGVSSTGDQEIGWNALGAGLGVARGSGGSALRAVLRRAVAGTPSVLGRGLGVEAGAGAWVSPGPLLRMWASAPQLWTRGAAPPLARALEIGATGTLDGVSLWIARRAPAGFLDSASHRAGIRMESAPLALWVEARDRPLRGLLGLEAVAAGFEIAGAVESHPVLGESVRLTVGAHAGRAP